MLEEKKNGVYVGFSSFHMHVCLTKKKFGSDSNNTVYFHKSYWKTIQK